MARIILKNVRLAFPHLFTPGAPVAGSTSPPKHSGGFIFAPGSDAEKIAQAEFARVAKEKWGPNATTIVTELAKDKKCLRRGDGKLDKSGVPYAGFAGNMYLQASNKARPVVVDQARNPLVEADGKPYGGCYVNACVEIYAQDKPGQGKSVNASLMSVQFLKDGESFGGGVGSADDFDDIADDADMFA